MVAQRLRSNGRSLREVQIEREVHVTLPVLGMTLSLLLLVLGMCCSSRVHEVPSVSSSHHGNQVIIYLIIISSVITFVSAKIT